MRSNQFRRIAVAMAAALTLLALSLIDWRAPDGGGSLSAVVAQGVALTGAEVTQILNQAEARANGTPSGLRNPAGETSRATKMHIVVVNRRGEIQGSLDIAAAKARTAAFFSSNENALTSRVIGELSQPHNPIGSGPTGPLWGIGDSNQPSDLAGSDRRNGLITFPGGVPLYKGDTLVGGIGVSGDGVQQDEIVAFAGTESGFTPGAGVVKLGMP
jgi:uncharacterized protein GlcG (DUF336 family)